MATSPVETVGTSYLLTRCDGPKLSAEREAYCFGATASVPSPASVDLDQQELCRGNLFCAQCPQISPGGQPAVASFLAPLDGGDIAHQIALMTGKEAANTMNPLLKEIRHTPLLWMLIFVPSS